MALTTTESFRESLSMEIADPKNRIARLQSHIDTGSTGIDQSRTAVCVKSHSNATQRPGDASVPPIAMVIGRVRTMSATRIPVNGYVRLCAEVPAVRTIYATTATAPVYAMKTLPATLVTDPIQKIVSANAVPRS